MRTHNYEQSANDVVAAWNGWIAADSGDGPEFDQLAEAIARLANDHYVGTVPPKNARRKRLPV